MSGPVAPDAAAPAELTAAELEALFPPRKVPTRPVVIPPLPETPRVHPTLQHLAADVAARLAGRRPVLTRTMGTYLGYDTFPAFSVHAEGAPGQNPGPCSATYVCAVAVQETSAEALDAAINAALAQARAAEAGRAA